MLNIVNKYQLIKTMKIRINNLFILISIFLYIITCFLPCFHVEGKNNIYDGYFVLLLGWIGVFIHDDIMFYYLAWYANIFYFTSLLLHKHNISILFAGLALIFSFFFIGCPYIIVDEAGHISSIVKMDIGYIIWIISIFLLLIGVCPRFMQPNADGVKKHLSSLF